MASRLRRISSHVISSAATQTSFPHVTAPLHYQRLIPGKRVGRYIGVPDAGELADEHDVVKVPVMDAREACREASLETTGFELRSWPTACQNFEDHEEIKRLYYKEIEALVKKATGCERVLVFDHTLRTSDAKHLNELGTGAAAGSVLRVHTDYTMESAPKRLQQLAEQGSYTGTRLSTQEQEALSANRFAFINVWRSIADEPVYVRPLALCDARSVDYRHEAIPYEMHYTDRIGANYALAHKERHRWFHYPKMQKDECILFKVYEKDENRTRTVFHTAFDDPTTPRDAPPRRSIECRTIACFSS
mmetsp:Transcript_76926/g.120226  ORF Transcript_76926/g.120226 Transcript_76926/m.120226 type:complete len:305 (+) Transcript_76926:50-964(+)